MRLAYSLRFRLMVFYLLIFLVPASLMMTVMPYYYQNSISRETQVLTESTLTSLARNIETYLDDLNRLTITPYLNEEVMRALKLKASPNYEETDAYARLVADRALETTLPLFMQNSRRDILTTVLVPADGKAVIASFGSVVAGAVNDFAYTEQDWHRRAVAADGDVVFISSHIQDYLDVTVKQEVFSVARLIKDPDTRRPLGVIMADADTNVLERIVTDIPFNVSSIVCIFDDQGKLLYASRPVPVELKQQIVAQMDPIRMAGDSYVTVSQEITPSDWEIVVLLSNAEIAANTRGWYLAGIFSALGGLVLTFALFFALSRWIVRPFQEMIAVMTQVQNGNMNTRFEVNTNRDEIAELGQALNDMIERLKQLIDREYKAVLGQREAEYRALQSQIQPHFLYNTLNNLVGLNRLQDSAGLEKAIYALSGMLHYILEGDDWVRLEDEILFIQKYCELQRIRHRERLTVEIFCESSLKDFKIPKLLLQPLVENAVIHGIEPASYPCRLLILIERQDNGIHIFVKDDGCGFRVDDSRPQSCLGLSNVRERLGVAFPFASMVIESQVEMGTEIHLMIPILIEEAGREQIH